MRHHMYKNLNISQLMDEYKPKMIVELGCDMGICTMHLLSLMYKHDFSYNLLTVDDGEPNIFNTGKVPKEIADHYAHIQGVSYQVMQMYEYMENIPRKFKGKIDMFLIDTDHNYWTLSQELWAIKPYLADNCVLIFHDTNIEYEDGHPVQLVVTDMPEYKNGTEYPLNDIRKCALNGLVITDAINEFLLENKDFKTIKQTTESGGAMAIAR